ncbi:hypothetical protein [Roseovarius indicus]|uniref:hypothetical protein n=1 Tax=Roseovarius indicus TaxID=540747 RepID=UPI0032EF349E
MGRLTVAAPFSARKTGKKPGVFLPGIFENSGARAVAVCRRRNRVAGRCGVWRKIGIFRVGILENSDASGGSIFGKMKPGVA